jgi:hypothetical protein
MCQETCPWQRREYGDGNNLLLGVGGIGGIGQVDRLFDLMEEGLDGFICVVRGFHGGVVVLDIQ